MNKQLRDLLVRVCAQLDVRAEYDPTYAGTEKPLNVEASLVNELRPLLDDPIALTNNSGQAHCPHCAVCHTSEETCIQALRRILALYERTEQGIGGVTQCA